MRLLLDTHAFLWFVNDDKSLSATAKTAIEDPTNDILISPVVYWEIAIKTALGQYTLNRPFQAFVEDQIAINQFQIIPILPRHTAAVIGLPFHHRDPFDRLLVAQAMIEAVPLVTCDAKIIPYPVTRIW